MVPPDPEGGVSDVQFAVVYSPKHSKENQNQSKRSNKRFSANCVEIKASEEEALSDADKDASYFAAKVLGPSKSSEGQFIFYLVEWLV
jgi:hypothetical protein